MVSSGELGLPSEAYVAFHQETLVSSPKKTGQLPQRTRTGFPGDFGYLVELGLPSPGKCGCFTTGTRILLEVWVTAFSRETRGAFPKELGLPSAGNYDSLPQRTRIAFFRELGLPFQGNLICFPHGILIIFPRKLGLPPLGNWDCIWN